VTLGIVTIAAITAVVGLLVGWLLNLDEGAEAVLFWIVMVALAVEVAPFIIGDIVNRKADREGG
jgi:hypothetical protein